MSITFGQRFLLIFVEFFIYLLWLIDVVTSFDLKKIFQSLKIALSSAISFVFVLFICYAVYSGNLAYLAQSVVDEYIFQPSSSIDIGSYPILAKKIDVPYFTARSVYVYERKKSKVLYEYDADQKLAPASTTKLMTAIVSRDLYKSTDVIKVPLICTAVDSVKAYFPENTEFTVEDLLKSMLIGSAGDSACVLSTGKLSYNAFVDQMNKKASEIGLENTHFSNPIGLDAANGDHYSTAKDLYKLASFAISDDFIKSVVKTRTFDLKDVNHTFNAKIYTTNQLLWDIPGSVGIKTGTTQSAGEVLIYEYDDGVKDIIIVVMGSQDRFNDTKNILTWILSSYKWERN